LLQNNKRKTADFGEKIKFNKNAKKSKKHGKNS
jgi:hypothetical protein